MGDPVDYALPIRTPFHYDRYRVRKESYTEIVRVAAAWEGGPVRSGDPGERWRQPFEHMEEEHRSPGDRWNGCRDPD